MSLLPAIRKALSSRGMKLLLAVAALTLPAGYFGGKCWMETKIQRALTDELKERGLAVSWQNAIWDPWRGMHLEKPRFVLIKGGSKVAEMDSLNIGFTLQQFLTGQNKATSFKIAGSSVVLHDQGGNLGLARVSLQIESSPEQLNIKGVKISEGGLDSELSGKILQKTVPDSPAETFVPDFSPIRTAMAILDFHNGGRFRLTGNFMMDFRKTTLVWESALKGEGSDIEWQGVRFAKIDAHATLSSEKSKIDYEMITANGSTKGALTRRDEQSPFLFTGVLRDGGGRADEYQGSYRAHVLTFGSLKGPADLLLLAKDAGRPVPEALQAVKFQTFPLVEIRNLRRDTASGDSRWTVGTLKVSAKDDTSFIVKDRKIEARNLSINAAYDGDEWIFRNSRAEVMDGSVALDGCYREGVLRQAKLAVRDIRLSELKRLGGDDRWQSKPGVVSADFQGVINLSSKELEGRGSMHLQDAPVFEVPLLDQVFDLFIALLPGVERSGKGEFDADFDLNPQVVEVKRFEAKGGSLTVSANGKVDLKKETVAGRARGKLVGLPGLVTSPLSRLLEMEVEGPFNDIRVKPLGPARLASNTASGTVGVVVDTLEETGKITGTVLTEGIKLPFRIFTNDPPSQQKKKP
ncbi:MAG: AsmA-like C-terminal region-containing protein [Luteolibacter sp.]